MQGAPMAMIIKLYINTASEAQRSRQRTRDCAGGPMGGERVEGWGLADIIKKDRILRPAELA